MIALHALWSRDSDVCVWGEHSSLPGRTGRRPEPPPATPGPSPHPFACRSALVLEALERLGASPASPRATAGRLVLRLPSSDLGPQASPHLLRVVDEDHIPDEGWKLVPWEVDVIRLTPSDATELLLELPSEAPSGVAIGDSLRYLAEVCKLALELLARGRLRPVLERRGERWLGLWRPVTDQADDDARVQLLVRSMPPLLRAEVSPWDIRPQALLGGFLAATVDAGARQLLSGQIRAAGAQEPAISGLLEAWLLALVAEEPTVAGDPWALARLAEEIEEWWVAGQSYEAQRMFRTCFRLVAPGDESDDASNESEDAPAGATPAAQSTALTKLVDRDPDVWRVEFLLQHKEDPSVLVRAEEVWAHSERLEALGRMLEIGRASCRERVYGTV